MTLLFHPFEIAAIGLSVLATAIVVLDGESNWVEGLQLLALYAILGLAFYFLPADIVAGAGGPAPPGFTCLLPFAIPRRGWRRSW